MPNIFEALAVPAGDGVGAWTNVEAMGHEKTVTVSGAFTGTITIEVSNDAGVGFAPIASFTNNKKRILKVSCGSIRVRRSGVLAPAGTPAVNVAANDDGVQLQNLPVSAGDGVGAAQDVDEFGGFWSIVVDATFTGTVTVEISEDSNNWEPLMSFTKSGTVQHKSSIIAAYARVRRSGVGAVPGTPNVDLAAVNEDESLINLFGDGSDGDVALGSNTTLTRDMLYNSLNTAGYDIDCAGFRIFVKTQCNITGNSIIQRNGNAGVAEAAGAALAAGSLGGSAAGGAGTAAAGAAGSALAQALGNIAGAGGLGAGGAAGAAGARTAPTAAESLPRSLPSSFSGYTLDGTIFKGGLGAGGGGGDGIADEGGGGGGGGGVVMINAKELFIEWTNGARIQALGGAGADGTATNCGGGGGGGGGAIIINYRRINMTNSNIISVSGGNEGESGGGTGEGGIGGTDGARFLNQL